MQDAAKQCLGLIPVKLPKLYSEAPLCYIPGVAQALARNICFSAEYYNNTWFYDALTLDPSQLLAGETGMWERGRPQPVLERKITNANIGTLPKSTPYIAVHREHGLLAWWPFHGAKHGGSSAAKDDAGRMWEGCPFWWHDLPLAEQQHIIDFNYYNTELALDKASDGIKERLALPFDERKGINGNNFLVRLPLSHTSLHSCSSNCTSRSISSFSASAAMLSMRKPASSDLVLSNCCTAVVPCEVPCTSSPATATYR